MDIIAPYTRTYFIPIITSELGPDKNNDICFSKEIKVNR